VRRTESLRHYLLQLMAWSAQGWQARLAQSLLDAALQRHESLGAHYIAASEMDV
jgi:L-aspartate oxidase